MRYIWEEDNPVEKEVISICSRINSKVKE